MTKMSASYKYPITSPAFVLWRKIIYDEAWNLQNVYIDILL